MSFIFLEPHSANWDIVQVELSHYWMGVNRFRVIGPPDGNLLMSLEANSTRVFLLPHFGQNVFEVYSTGTAHKWVVGVLLTACVRETAAQDVLCHMLRNRNRKE